MEGRRLRRIVALQAVFGIGIAIIAGCEREDPALGREVVAGDRTSDPGSLREIMAGLGREMDEMARGFWIGDLASVEAAARSIAAHPRVAMQERARIQDALGSAFAGFVRADRSVHDAALRVAASAASGDMVATLGEWNELQSECVNCHQTFRDRLRNGPVNSR